ncbi:protein ECERIFERUM 16 isoform X1 [Gastrolobium bilobum]|uniref:protein ECERIFERUM 16 isoform X1 n=1 Tax=Gastrolobium bilobum TaxID=150636 RepID=UPI002AB0D9CD|nr:protein ECERIFERUM 16 isoform X1 [Gastrolobium bilobum]
MDVKALAKSKRGHTQQHSKKHHSQKLKAPSPSSSGSNDATKKKPLQVNEKRTHGSRSQGSSALPTNWDRYEEEEFDSGSEGVSPESASKNLDVVLPKSKGADFRHLVAEAQFHADTTTLEGFPSLDDLLPGEFGVGLSSMLAVRGEGILSWVGDENFVVEDKTSANQEASFISMNLLALAENLAKVDLSKRLFIESDLLPTELCVEDLAVGSTEEPDELETREDSELSNRLSKGLNLDDSAADQFTSSSSSSSGRAASAFTLSNNSLIPVNHINVESQQVGSSGENKAFIPSAEDNLHSTENTRTHSTFGTAAAEEELDMLLDSLSETKILDSQGFKSNTSFPVSLGVSSVDRSHVSNKETVPSKTASVTASLDDELDDLLEETSTLMNPNVLLRPQEEKPVRHSIQSSSHSESKSKVSDDFDSWFDTL